MTSWTRRQFVGGTLGCVSSCYMLGCRSPGPMLASDLRNSRTMARIRGAFFYPPAEVVLAGQCEDSWAREQWFTWPGNQFEPDQQRAKFISAMGARARNLGVELSWHPAPLYTTAAMDAWLAEVQKDPPDALLLVNFWNSFSSKVLALAKRWAGPVLIYHPVGSNHQVQWVQRFRALSRADYVHSIEHWDAVEAGLRAVCAGTFMRRAHLLRVVGRVGETPMTREPLWGTRITTISAEQFNQRFDQTQPTSDQLAFVERLRARAQWVGNLEPTALRDAIRAHLTVAALMKDYEADAITIECLFLKHRKPCLSFALHNAQLTPCGCENDLNATLTLMIGETAFRRPGFQHNPEFDTERNHYFGAHCTCAWQLEGPSGPKRPYAFRPFFHQLPRTLAVDVEWPRGERVTLLKYHSGQARLDVRVGECLGSPKAPPTGGCATRVLVRWDHVRDVTSMYPGPHPVLFLGDFGRTATSLARLYGLALNGPEDTSAPPSPEPKST